MRKLSDFLNKSLISAVDGTLLGVIEGVFCESRLKSIEYLYTLQKNGEKTQFLVVTPRSAKLKNDKCVVLSKNLCIKNAEDFEEANLVNIIPPVSVTEGKNNSIGTLTDVFFGETKKNVEGLLVDGKIILPERVDTATANEIVLLPDGRKRRSRTTANPQQDYAVEILPQPFPFAPASVRLDSEQIDTVQTFADNTATPTSSQNYMPNKFIGNYRFLLGRVVTANIYNSKRELIIKTGALVTAEVVLSAHKNGKLIDLTLNSRP